MISQQNGLILNGIAENFRNIFLKIKLSSNMECLIFENVIARAGLSWQPSNRVLMLLKQFIIELKNIILFTFYFEKCKLFISEYKFPAVRKMKKKKKRKI